MKAAIITNNELREELLAQGLHNSLQAEWLTEPAPVEGAGCYIDLLFEKKKSRIEALKKLEPAIIIVNEVAAVAGEIPDSFIRVNAWPGFLKRQLVEAAFIGHSGREIAELVFAGFGKKMEWVTAEPGFISARVVSMIINEAYLALEENVSSKEEIDVAMRLGTNYPYGPFEWGQKIGLKNIYQLLDVLAKANDRYQPAALLKIEAFT
jgi:3-hydroxybutyryl-CoA dehydrogenase